MMNPLRRQFTRETREAIRMMRGVPRRIPIYGSVIVSVVFAMTCDGSTEPPPNRAPRAVGSISPIEVAVRDTSTVDVSAYFSDPDGDELD